MGRWRRGACSSCRTRYALCKVSTCTSLVFSSFALSFIFYLSALLATLASPAPNTVALTTATAPALPVPCTHTRTHSHTLPLAPAHSHRDHEPALELGPPRTHTPRGLSVFAPLSLPPKGKEAYLSNADTAA
jgi:hypothetical protein